MNLYTIGHSNHPIEQFLELLSQNGITALVDVRSTPYSRFHPQYNKAALQKSLVGNSVEYLYMGDTLGGRPSDPTCYIHKILPKNNADYVQEIDYAEVMQRPWFIQGIAQLLDLAEKQTLCTLCSEGDPLQCHRHHLIARYSLARHPELSILHILRDGGLLDAKSLSGSDDNPVAQQLSF